MEGASFELDAVPVCPELAAASTSASRWWVAHTRSRNEKALARDLDRLAIVKYLPLRQSVTRSLKTGRCTESLVPVFTSYLFFCASDPQRHQVLATNRVAKTLFVLDQQRLIDQLRDVQRVIVTGTAFEHFCGVRVGQWVRVVGGALAGVEGCVTHKRGKTRLAISVDILGQSVLADVDARMLEAIDVDDIGTRRRLAAPC